MGKRIIVAGASGLVGSTALPLLVAAGFDVHCLFRTHTDPIIGVTSHIAPTQHWPDIVKEVRTNIAVSCLGTTIRTAGSQAAFAAVDLDLVTAFAAATKISGAKQFIGVSSVGADIASSNFYLKTKGQMEAAVGAIQFERTDFLRPGLLRGKRNGTPRYGERLGIMLSPITDLLLIGPLQRYRSIASEDVALAICALALHSGAGKQVYENVAIIELARGLS
jgi:uncharacterized protein YbjT (DUF2867 family)